MPNPVFEMDIFIEITIDDGFKTAKCNILDIESITTENVESKDDRELTQKLIEFMEDNMNMFINRQLSNITFPLERTKHG